MALKNRLVVIESEIVSPLRRYSRRALKKAIIRGGFQRWQCLKFISENIEEVYCHLIN